MGPVCEEHWTLLDSFQLCLVPFRPWSLLPFLRFLWGLYRIFFKKDFIYLYVHGCFASMYRCTSHACSAHRGQERAFDSLGLELQLVVSRHVGAGSILSLWKINSELPAISLVVDE